jgi:hypothetical protein
MSDQAWALQAMFKYRLQVNFSRRTIECRGIERCWQWVLQEDFYRVLTNAINDIEKTNEI